MSNIQKSKPDRLVEAMKSTKFRDGIDRKRLVEIYRKALALAGHRNFEPEQISTEITLLSEILQRHFIGITIEELAYISEKGAVGEYGEFHGINPATFAKWIRRYQDSYERRSAIERSKNKPKQLAQSKNLNRLEKQNLWNDRKKQYLETGSLVGEIILYEIGKELGMINVKDKEFISEVKKQALKWFRNEKLRLIEEGGLTQKWAVAKVKEVLEMNEETRSHSGFWVNRCKRIAVQMIMNQK